MKFATQLISAIETYAIRAQMRPLKSKQEQGNPEDLSPTTFHVGCFANQNLIGIASFHEEPHPRWPHLRSYRLRGMGTDKQWQHQGVGSLTLHCGINELQKRGVQLVWCNARESAFEFYLKQDFLFHGEMFDIAEIGPHKVMYKSL